MGREKSRKNCKDLLLGKMLTHAIKNALCWENAVRKLWGGNAMVHTHTHTRRIAVNLLGLLVTTVRVYALARKTRGKGSTKESRGRTSSAKLVILPLRTAPELGRELGGAGSGRKCR